MARPQLEAALKALRPGDTLVVWKLDRLGRNVRGLSELLENLEKRGVFFESLTGGIDTSKSVGKLMFHILAAVAEMESNLVSERTKAGLAAMRERNGGSGLVLDVLHDSLRRRDYSLLRCVRRLIR